MTQTVNIEGVGVVHFPDGYSQERIKFAIENDIIPRVKAQHADPVDQARPEKPTALERLGRGFDDVRQGVKQGALMLKDVVTGKDEAGAYTREKTDEEKLYERGRGKDAGWDLMRLGGNVLGTAPAALIPGAGSSSLALRILSGGAQGAASGAAMFAPEGTSKGEQAVLGSVAGGAVPAAAAGIRRAAGGAVDRVRALLGPAGGPSAQIEGELTFKLQQHGVDFNKLTQEAKASLLADAQKTLSAGGTLDDVALANKATIEAIPGAKATRASVTRAPRDWQTEKNLRGVAGVGDDIVARERGNAKAMTDYLEKLSGASGATAKRGYQVGESVRDAVQGKFEETGREVSKLYGEVRKLRGDDVGMEANKLIDTMIDLQDIGKGKGKAVYDSVASRMQRFGLIDDDGAPAKVAAGSAGKVKQPLTVTQAEELRKFIGSLGGNPTDDMMVKRLVSALDEDVTRLAGDDAFKQARAAAAQRFREFDAKPMESLLQGKVGPEDVVERLVLGGKVDDLRKLRTSLNSGSPEQVARGSGAWNNVRGAVFDHFLLKATGATSLDDVGGKPFSGVRFAKALESIEPEKLHMLFKPAEVEALRTLQKASKLLTEEVPFSDVNHSKTTAALANLLQKIGSTPLLGQVVGMIAGPVKLGLDWSKNAADRKKVAEALVGSAGQAGKRALLPPSTIEKLAPGVAGSSAGAMSYQE